MKTIRYSVYETNSSSTHNLTIDTTNYPNKSEWQGAVIERGEFGWEYEKFNDFKTKASYFWTLAEYNDEIKGRMEYLANKYDFELVTPASNDYKYVDHGTEHYDRWLKKHPELGNGKGLWEFLTSESCWIMLGNDNGYSPADWEYTPKQAKNAPYKLILCLSGGKEIDRCSMDDNNRDTVERNIEIAVGRYYEKMDRDYTAPYPRVKEIDWEDQNIRIDFERYNATFSKYETVKHEALTFKIKEKHENN